MGMPFAGRRQQRRRRRQGTQRTLMSAIADRRVVDEAYAGEVRIDEGKVLGVYTVRQLRTRLRR